MRKLIVAPDYDKVLSKRRSLKAEGYVATSLRHMRSPSGDTVTFVWLTDNVRVPLVSESFDEVEGMHLLSPEDQGYVRLRMSGAPLS